MRMRIGLTAIVAVCVAASAGATLISVEISPGAGLALSSVNYADGDHAMGLSPLNAVDQPASPATGGTIASGIVFDDITKELSYNIAYGSDFGFVDLVGNYSAAHIHGPIAVQYPSPNTLAGIVVPLNHTAGSSTHTGSFSDTIVLDSTQEANLLDNLLYVNIHSSFTPGGELRGQLVPVVIPEPAAVALVLVGVAVLGCRRRRRD